MHEPDRPSLIAHRPSSASDDDNLIIRFTDMAYGGDAVGRLGDGPGVAVFAWPGIEGERARVAVTERRRNLLRGAVTEVLEPSPLRVEPPCPYFGPCGGCQWQHVAYAGQVKFKHDILRSQLERIGGIEAPDLILKDPIESPRQFGYRNTSHFALHTAASSLGYFKRDSHAVVPVDRCPISNDGINASIPLINSMLAQAPGEDFVREQSRGVMRVWQVAIRSGEATGHTLVAFHTARPESPQFPRRGGRPRSHPAARPEGGPGFEPDAAGSPGVPLLRREVRRAVAELDRQGPEQDLALTLVEIMEDGTTNVLGATRSAGTLEAEVVADSISGSLAAQAAAHRAGAQAGPPVASWVEKLGAHYFWVAPGAFFQVNTQAAELLLTEVSANVPARLGLLVDAHAGVGTFAISLHERTAEAICFEPNPASIASGRWTAAAARAGNVEFRHGRAESLLARLPYAQKPDLILLDPPRSGCHPDLLAEIARRHIPRIVYVSCDPSTLARDIKALSGTYRLSSARVVDMFPQTFHLETVAVLDLLFC